MAYDGAGKLQVVEGENFATMSATHGPTCVAGELDACVVRTEKV